MTHERSVTLHQQDGGLSLQAFADREGLTPGQVKRLAKGGKILGARQDARSKHWWIYPPAKLLPRPRSHNVRSASSIVAADCAGLGTERDTPRAAPSTGAGVMAASSCGHADTHPAQAVEGTAAPLPAKPVFAFGSAAFPEAARSLRARPPERCGKPAVYTEARSVCQALREAQAQQHREGIHYLRLDAHEFSQLYASLDRDRSRIRKLVGRGVLPVGRLRASDSVWQKLQAMSHEGRLL